MIFSITLLLPCIIGATISSRFNQYKLGILFGAFNMIIATTMPFRSFFIQKNSSASSTTLLKRDIISNLSSFGWDNVIPMVSLGALTGILSGFFGVGGGSIMVPGLVFLTPMPYHQILGTSLTTMVGGSAVAFRRHWQLGNVVPRAVIPLAVGATVGAYLGSKMAVHVNEQVLVIMFSALVGILGFRQFS